METNSDIVTALNERSEKASLNDRLRLARELISGQLVFTTSFGLEDQMITHALADCGVTVEFSTLDTGRLFPETYDVWAETERRYGIRVKPFYPQAEAIETLVAEIGINGFYASLQDRKACCYARKVEPLGRALAGAAGWITGLRGQQSQARVTTPFAEHDRARDLIKINPLFDWDREWLQAQIRDADVPYNVLHDQGYLSIGCQPCTRPVKVGENERAGRWWWELSSQECGLHVASDPGSTAGVELIAAE